MNMNTNLGSPTKLTEFAPLQAEVKSQSFSQVLTKFLKLSTNSFLPGSEIKVSETISVETKDGSSSFEPNSVDSTCYHSEGIPVTYMVDINEGRSLPNVLKRISNLLALKTDSLQDYSDTELKQYWMPDSVSKECYECCEKFSTFRRKHHCRVCGQIFCSQCCNQQIPGKIFGCTGDLRVCTYCCKVVLSYLQSSDVGADLSTDLRILQENLQIKLGTTSVPATVSPDNISEISDGRRVEQNSISRKFSQCYQEETFGFESSLVGCLTKEEKIRALQSSQSLRNLFEEICNPLIGLTLKSHRYGLKIFTECFLGSDLVDWLIHQQKANNRLQATAICEALLDGGYIEWISEPSFVDGYALYKPCVYLSDNYNRSESPLDQVATWIQSDLGIVGENESFYYLSNSSSYTLDLNLKANTAHLSRPSTFEFGEGYDTDDRERKVETIVRTSEQRELVPESGWYHASVLREENGEKMSYNGLTDSFRQHELHLTSQLLKANGLADVWDNIVVSLIHEIVNVIRPDKNHDAIDIDLRHYIKFKKLPGGLHGDTKLVDGIAFSKNIAHKDMATNFENPIILLLQCSIVYQRTEGRLMSLEPVLMQEYEYLRNVAARIVALQPNIVLVQKNVSRLAQDLLREHGITLVYNVKQSILERLSLCTGADIVAAVDAHIGRPKLGTCKRFYLKSFYLGKGESKILMFFEGLISPHLGSTVLLRGATKPELSKLEAVTSFLLLAAYNWRLEKSYLMDAFVKPPHYITCSNFNMQNVFNSSSSALISEEQTVVTNKSNKNNKQNKTSGRLFDSDSDEEGGSGVSEKIVGLPFSDYLKTSLDNLFLCLSPYVKYPVPFLCTESGENCKLRMFFPSNIYFSRESFDSIMKTFLNKNY